MNYKNLYPYLIFFPVAFLQITFASMISFNNITPDLVLIILVLFTLSRGQISGTILGFSFGLIFDLISGGIIGSAAFSKSIAGFVAGYFFDEYVKNESNRIFKTTMVILLCSSIDSFLYTLLGTAELINVGTLFISQSILSAVFTVAISVPILIAKPERFLS